MASVVDGLISFLGGLYCTLIAFGVVRASKDAAKEAAWRAKWSPFLKIAGPLVMAFGIWNMFRGR
jgi:hypothetical protein